MTAPHRRPGAALLAALLALPLAALPAPALAGPAEAPMNPEARSHLDRALDLYQRGEHAAAIEAFKAGYAIDPRRDFLFAWAQAERLSGDCVTAIELYKRFIAERPADVQIAAAETQISACEEQLVAKRASAAEDAARAQAEAEAEAEAEAHREAEEQARAEAEAEEQARQEAERERARRFYLDPLGDGLVAGGVAAALTGGALLTVAQVKQQRLLDAPTYGDFAARYDDVSAQSRTFRIAGGALLGVGAALVAGGVVRWMIVRRGGGSGARASARLIPIGAGAAIAGSF